MRILKKLDLCLVKMILILLFFVNLKVNINLNLAAERVVKVIKDMIDKKKN